MSPDMQREEDNINEVNLISLKPAKTFDLVTKTKSKNSSDITLEQAKEFLDKTKRLMN